MVGVLSRALLPAGLAPTIALDNKPYTSILYGNGPGASFALTGNSRPNVSHSQSSERRGPAGRSGAGGGRGVGGRGGGLAGGGGRPPRRP